MRMTVQLDSFKEINFNNFFFPMITIYNNPSDFPGKYVARVFDVKDAKAMVQPYAVIKNSLNDVRESLPSRFVKMPRDVNDDPAIVEVWI